MQAATHRAPTSFFGNRVSATPNEMRGVAGRLGAKSRLSNVGDPYGNFEWDYTTEDGEPFSVYDRNNAHTLADDEVVEWHIAAADNYCATSAEYELREQLEQSA